MSKSIGIRSASLIEGVKARYLMLIAARICTMPSSMKMRSVSRAINILDHIMELRVS